MIHFAIGMFVLSLTFAVLTVISLVSPDVKDAPFGFWTGAIAAVASSGALLYFVRRWRV